MTWDGVRRWMLRVGGAAQVTVITATAASFVGTLAGPLWRQSRSGCVVSEMVTCTPAGIDHAGRWPAAVAGGLVALAVVMTDRRARRIAQALVLAVVTLGTAAFAADQARYSGDRAAVCISYGHGCAYPAWHLGALVAGATVGVGVALLALAGEGASRRALDAPALGVRRIVVGVLMVGAVPLGLIGLWSLLGAPDGGDKLIALALVSAAVLGLLVGQILRTRSPNDAAPA